MRLIVSLRVTHKLTDENISSIVTSIVCKQTEAFIDTAIVPIYKSFLILSTRTQLNIPNQIGNQDGSRRLSEFCQMTVDWQSWTFISTLCAIVMIPIQANVLLSIYQNLLISGNKP